MARRGRYGWRHQQLRKALKLKVDRGEVSCARCGKPILPGQAWDLGHDDDDHHKYNGPEHAFKRHCPAGGNRATVRHLKERAEQVSSRRW